MRALSDTGLEISSPAQGQATIRCNGSPGPGDPRCQRFVGFGLRMGDPYSGHNYGIGGSEDTSCTENLRAPSTWIFCFLEARILILLICN